MKQKSCAAWREALWSCSHFVTVLCSNVTTVRTPAVRSSCIKRNIPSRWSNKTARIRCFLKVFTPQAEPACLETENPSRCLTDSPYWTRTAPAWLSPSEGRCPAAWTEISSSCVPVQRLQTRSRLNQGDADPMRECRATPPLCARAVWEQDEFTGISERSANQRSGKAGPSVRPRPQRAAKIRAGSVRADRDWP